MTASRRRAGEALALALVLAAAAWIHRGALAAPFFTDDYLFLDQIQGRSLAAALALPDPIGNYVRPLGRQAWFWCVAAVGESSPRVFHLANLGLFLVAVGLLYAIARRMLGPRAALVAASLLALSHAADVPVLWASGSQDLLAVVGALGAILLFLAGRRLASTLAFVVALLSKEVALLVPPIAALAARRRDEPWRTTLARAWPLLVALAAWGIALWLAGARSGANGLGAATLTAVPATLAHLLQTVAGLEWPRAGLAHLVHSPPPAALVPVLLALALAARMRPAEEPRAGAGPAWDAAAAGGISRRRVAATGAAWALLGALPVAVVAGIWSAYYFLFALCGAALALAALTAARPAWIAMLLVAAIGWTSENARRLPEFSTAAGAWTARSHVNRHYLERGMGMVERYLSDLRRARPTLPPSSTLFFSRIPIQIGFQAADGPLLRWAYRDTSLRSHFLTRFRIEHTRRGPVFFFQAWNDTLSEVAGPDSLERIGLGLVLSGAPEAARDALTLAWRHDPRTPATAYRLGIVEIAMGRPDSARAWLERAGARVEPGPAPEAPAALARLAAGDTAGAIALASAAVSRHALDPSAHALLADLFLVHQGLSDGGLVEAYAARVIDPDDPLAWRRWGLIAALRNRDGEARDALERYFAGAGAAARGDSQALAMLALVRRRLPGGDLAQEAVRAAGADP